MAGRGSAAIGMVGMGVTVMVGMDIVVIGMGMPRIGMVGVEVAGMAMEVGNKVTLFVLLTGVLVTFF